MRAAIEIGLPHQCRGRSAAALLRLANSATRVDERPAAVNARQRASGIMRRLSG